MGCADCGCVVNRGVIVRACDQYPDCCCRELSVKKDISDSQEG